MHTAVAHVHAIDDGITKRSAALDDPPTHTFEICSTSHGLKSRVLRLCRAGIRKTNDPLCRGHLQVQSRISRGGFGLNRFDGRRVFSDDLLALLGRIMPMHTAIVFPYDPGSGGVMAFLDVVRDMRLRLHSLNTLWR